MAELVTVEEALTRHREEVLAAIRAPELQGLIWEATRACNLTCLHCGNPAEGKAHEGAWEKPQELSTDEVKRIFAGIAADYDARRIAIGITGGEATLRRDLCEIVAYFKTLGFGSVSLTTNCLLTGRDPSLVDRLVEAGVSLFTISLDGASKGHDTQRCLGGSFDEVVKTIRYLRARHPHVGITVNTVATPFNWHEVPEVYRLMAEFKIPVWHLGPVSPVGRASDPSTHLSNEQLRDLLEWIADKNRPVNREATGVRVSWLCDGWVGSEFEGRVRESIFFCGAGTRIASVLYDGKAGTCLEVNRAIAVQGDLRTERFKDVWEGRYSWFRTDREKFRKGPCETCAEWQWCQGSSLHLREENGELIECIYYRQSKSAPRPTDDALPAMIETAELAPLSMVERDGSWIVGNPETGTFAEMPLVAVRLLRALQRSPKLADAQGAVSRETGREVDVDAFVRSITAGGFVERLNGAPVPERLRPKKRRTVFDRLGPEHLGWMKSPLLAWLVALPAVAGLAVIAAEPSYLPSAADFFWTDWYTLVGLTTFLTMIVVVAKHELSHVLLARAYGSRASLSLGTRVFYLAVQTDASDLWLLPARDRVKVYAAGMWSDASMGGLAILVAFLGESGAVPAFGSPTVVGLAKLAALLCFLQILTQFFLHLRMDVYYMVAHGLDCRNLYGDAQAWLRKRLSRVVPRWRKLREPVVAPREMRWVRLYGLLHFVGLAFLLTYFGFFALPALVRAYGFALGTLADAALGAAVPWRASLDAVLFIGIHAAYFGIVGLLHWRNRARDTTGVLGSAPDGLTRRLLSHPAPEGMRRTAGGKLVQLGARRPE
ncbi:MAG: radical SAM/SPASM domain-containing protein [Methanobacteriota archaeon]